MFAPITPRAQMLPVGHSRAADQVVSRIGETPGSVSLADIISRLQANSDLNLNQQHQMISALRTVARLLDADPADIPAEPRYLRNGLNTLSPGIAGIGHGRWNNIRSLMLAALHQAGVRIMPGRAREPHAPVWEALRARLPDAKARLGLSRFMSFCCTQQIRPEAVDAAIFEAFREALATDSLVRNPHAVHRTACVLWNRAAQTIDGWSDRIVTVPSASRRYALDWESFPRSFRTDAEAFLDRFGNQDPFSDSYAVPAKPSTVAMRRKQILQIATALVSSGQSASAITDLATLVQVPNAKLALRFFLDRAGGKQTKYLHQQALLIKTIARHWSRVNRDQVDALGEICRRLAVKNTGMTDKNRARLRQFDEPANVAALVNLPGRVQHEVQEDDPGGRREALRVMFALAVELLLVAPMRINNLTGLEIARHFVRTGSAPDGAIHLVIPALEMKNSMPYELALPRETAAFLTDYLTTYRLQLSPRPSPWLFPNDQGERRNITSFATEIADFVLRETGIRMNVHLFRYLAAKFHLEAYPDDIETVRQILGHRSVTTTLRTYTDIKTVAAFQRYDDIIAGLREQSRMSPEQGAQRGRGRP